MEKTHITAVSILVTAVSSLALVGCSGVTPGTLTPLASERVHSIEQLPDSTGEQIYEGRVHALDGRTEPLYTYERRIRRDEDAITSTHITHDPTGAVVVVQSAAHSPDYQLQRADLMHRQSGVSASVVVADGEAIYTLHDGEREATARETLTEPLVAGPTMFGFILAHWGALARGETIPIRFAVLERGESLRFALDRVDAPAGRTIIRMRATSPLVRLAVSSTYFEFDSRTRHIIEYTGRVPPLDRRGDKMVALDARVAYSFVARDFR